MPALTVQRLATSDSQPLAAPSTLSRGSFSFAPPPRTVTGAMPEVPRGPVVGLEPARSTAEPSVQTLPLAPVAMSTSTGTRPSPVAQRQTVVATRRDPTPRVVNGPVVQRLGLGSLTSGLGKLGGMAGSLFGNYLGGGQQGQEEEGEEEAPTEAPKKIEESKPTTSAPSSSTSPESSNEELRKFAARIYPYISERLKTELGRDRERAGMITGLHR
jgi:hypothetical protein